MTTIDYAIRVATGLQSEGKLERANLILQSILEGNPQHAFALHLSGIIAYQMGKIAEGIELIQQAITSNADVALFHSNLGEMYRQTNQLPLSIQHGQRAVALDPTSATAFSNLGIAYYDAETFEQAEQCHQQALALNPNLSCSLNNMGSIYKMAGKTELAIKFYLAAVKASPQFVDPLHNLATLFLQQQDFINAETYIKKAIALLPQKMEFHQLLAEIYHEQGKNSESLKCLDHALTLDNTLASLYLSKGNIFMETGDIVSAHEQFSKAANDASIDTRVLAYYSLVQLRKIKPADTNLNALTSIADTIHEVAPNKQEYVYFALGKCHDDLGNWTKAFDYFKQGNQLKRKSFDYDINADIQLTNKIIHDFSKETIEHMQAFANDSTLPIFIVGMPRSGTTLIEQILSSHSNVYGAGELTYLNDLTKTYYTENFSQLAPQTYRDISEKYLASLKRFANTESRITDKMPHNFVAIGLIHALLPNAKIIHVKRNAIDTCLSCYTKLFSRGQLFSYDLTELGHYYLCYNKIMQHWRNLLPQHAFLEIDYETVIVDLETQAKRLLSYCDLDWEPACLAFYHAKRNIRTASFMQVREPIYTSSMHRWRHYEKELAPLISILNTIN